jgi:hypothetical protein
MEQQYRNGLYDFVDLIIDLLNIEQRIIGEP